MCYTLSVDVTQMQRVLCISSSALMTANAYEEEHRIEKPVLKKES